MVKYLLLMLSVLATSLNAAETPKELPGEGFVGHLYEVGDLFLAGQPKTKAALESMAEQDVTLVVNLRTPEEMSSEEHPLPDEAELLGELGIRYVSLPSGKDHPMNPDTVTAFAELMATNEGKVLLHCGSSRRATHLWVAYLAEHKGMLLDRAIELGRQANFGTSALEGFLSRPIHYQLQE